MVFYRKYRPQIIEELDSKEVREKLANILKGSSLPHAFLFTGPKGLGKTSTARIIAKSINCEKKTKGIEPCNECEQCRSITNGTNMDILEIDGASNRGIDEIRDLREKIKLSPMGSKKKIYIIDEVHMLTTEAFNALLKTLEEPPSHVVFILCTTELHKVPATILSRCLRIQFKKATAEELIRSFERIVKNEKAEAELEALKLIASMSDGSFRDGTKVLEEVISASKGKKITREIVEKTYSIASTQYQIAQMIKSLEEKDIKRALGVIVKITREGVEMEYFMQGLIEALHNILLLKVGVEVSGSGLVIDSSKLEIFQIKKLIELLSNAKNELKYAVLSQMPLELAVVEWCSFIKEPVIVSSATPAKKVNIEVNNPALSASAMHPSNQQPQVNIPVQSKVTQQDMAEYSENDALWTALIDKVKIYNHSVAGVLRGCSIKSYDGKILLLETNFKFHKEKLNERKTKDILDRAVKEATRKDIKIEVILKGVKN